MARATPITYGDFSSLSGLQLNGAVRDLIHTCDPSGNTGCDVLTDGFGRNVLRLTNAGLQAGSAFTPGAVTMNSERSFSAAFAFRMSDSTGSQLDSDDGLNGADGLVFVVQSNSLGSSALGNQGSNIGYRVMANSVGVEFDTWSNGNQDQHSGNHVGIDLNGSVVSDPLRIVPIADPGGGLPFGPMNNGADWFAWVDYNGALDQLEVRLANSNVRPTDAYLSKTLNLALNIGANAFFGFTSGNGTNSNDHDIISFSFQNDYEPFGIAAVPAPGALALMGLGLFGCTALGRLFLSVR